MKKITFLFFVFTFSIWHMNAQFNEGFEAGIPANWSVINGGDPGTWVAGAPGGGTAAHTGTNVAKIAFGSVAHDDYLITQQFTVTAGVSDRFSFWYRHRSNSFPEIFDILLSSGGNTASDFTVTIEAGVIPTTIWTPVSYDLTDYVGQTVYIAFHSTTTDQYELDLDDISLDTTPADLLDYYNLQYPATGAINAYTDFNVYAQAYEAGLTDVTSGQAPGIESWIGYSSSNTNPNGAGWTWVQATFNVESGNNDEYTLNLGTTIQAAGTFYYASRWRLNGGVFTYGGIKADSSPGGVWGEDNNISGVLTITSASNDVCSGANVVSALPYNFSQTDGALSTNNDGFISACSASDAGGMNDGLWFTFTAATDGTVDIAVTNVDGWDPQLDLYSGSCGAFTCVANVDAGAGSGDETITTQAVTANTQYFINVGYYSETGNSPEGNFDIQVTGTFTLAVNDFENANAFSYFPNPVKNELTLKAQSNIQNVSIYNMLGQEVLKTTPNTLESNVNMNQLQSGAYFVKVTINDATETIRVIKQ